jgi:hypothetical protein
LLHGLPFLKRFIQILSQYDKRDNYASDLFRGSLTAFIPPGRQCPASRPDSSPSTQCRILDDSIRDATVHSNFSNGANHACCNRHIAIAGGGSFFIAQVKQ